jgi:hypothetical protein
MRKRRSQSRSNRRTTKTAGSWGSNSNSVETLSKMLTHVEASVQDRVVAPSQEEMRRAVDNGECPFCGNQYQNIAVHTNRTHGVDKNQLKIMLGIPKSHSVCTPELSEKCAERSRQMFADRPELKEKMKPRSKKRDISEAGKAINMAKLATARKALEDKAAAEGMTANEWTAQLNSKRRRQETAERDRKIIELAQSGASSADICAQAGVDAEVIRNTLRFYGIDAVDFRRRRPPPPREQIEAAHAARDALVAAQANERLSRWTELGKDWDAVHTCAAEWGISTGSVVYWLRKYGEKAPDGRQTPKREPSQIAAYRLQRWRELGGDWDAVLALADELQLRAPGVAQYLRLLGEEIPDGRVVSPNRFAPRDRSGNR